MTYATPEEVKLAESLGYQWDANQQRGHHFQKGNRRVWACSLRADNERLMGWQTADVISDETGQKMGNHQPYKELQDALRRPL